MKTNAQHAKQTRKKPLFTDCRYYDGSTYGREIVEFDVIEKGRYITTCVVDVKSLLNGANVFPCGNGDDFELSLKQRIVVNDAVLKGRGR